MKNISELRQDIVSGDWVVIATGRSKRPNDFLVQKHIPFTQPKSTCPFEKRFPDARVVYGKNGPTEGSDWWVQTVLNKYPAFDKGICAVFNKKGPYVSTNGAGAHEVVITADHTRSFADMTDQEAELVVHMYQDRFRMLQDDICVKYISLFHNHGKLAGASIAHPHSQIIAIPVVPPDVASSLEGSERYFAKEKKCVHCIMLQYDLKEKTRIVYSSKYFAAVTPFASRTAFEIRIFPKVHQSRFEDISPDEQKDFAHVLRVSLAKLYRGLKNPDYNFFLHTAPVNSDVASRVKNSHQAKLDHSYEHYHWHFEILPKTAIWAGFEIGTGIEISTISPESAAKFLRKIKI
ncbi:MAG: galactose-1-phosphate uridylyltransferase [Candidatus Sungbacteria bacterium]|nr:galactose-1-phosphate uridylyltransferase [Candidatus Sungbacteria bacterium]